LLNFVGEEKGFKIYLCTGYLRRRGSIEELLTGYRPFWFFQRRDSFMRQDRFMKWDPDRLDRYILLPVEYGFVNEKDCLFVSHYWRSREHPDPRGEDFRLFRKGLGKLEWSYVWADWTCAPQDPRSETQREYFKKVLQSIPYLIRDCTFEWRYPKFEPRAWILFEVAEGVFDHSKFNTINNIARFHSHVQEMIKDGVRPVIDKYGYKCKNGGDLQLVIGWLELLVILHKILPRIGSKRQFYDMLDKPWVGTFTDYNSGITIDKANGVVSVDGTNYKFTPLNDTSLIVHCLE
jgi:hypothetical protein